MTVCEDLATKAELQELRDQLNEVLGKKEEGGTEQLFAKGKSPTVAAGAVGVTLLGLTQTRAANAIVDIGVDKAAEGVVWKELAQGKAKWISTKGNGVKKTVEALNTVSKTAGAAGGGAALGSKTAGVAAGGVLLLANLVNIAMTLALNIATVKVLDKRIDAEARGTQVALDAINGSMLRLYEKNQGDIDAVNAQLADNQVAVEINRQNLEVVRTEISEARRVNDTLVEQVNQAETNIQDLQAQNKELVQEINSSNLEFENVTSDLITSVQNIQTQLETAIETLNTQKEDIATINEELEYIELELQDLDQRISIVESEIAGLQIQFDDLRADLEPQIELNEARSKLNSAKLILLENKTVARGGGGSPPSVNEGVVNGQNKLLELANGLTASPIRLDTVTTADLLNNSNKFETQIDQLLSNIGTSEVEQQQLDDLEANMTTNFQDILETTLQVGVIAKLNQINNQTNQTQLRQAAETAICNSLNGGGCSATSGTPNPTQGLGGMMNGLLGRIDSLNAGLNGTIIAQNAGIRSIVQSTNNTVLNATHGLQAVQNFAETAWRATKADKILGAVNTVLLVHNGMMLSNNLASTLSEALNVSLQALGIRDEADNPIDIGKSVGDKIQSMLTSVLGTENYAALTVRIAKANRIYQAGANVLQTTQELFDSARTITELAAENTGQIGNALREAGVVYEDAYREMLDEVNETTTAMHRLDKFRAGIEEAERGLSLVTNVSSEIVSIQENMQQLEENKAQWREEVEGILVKKEVEKANVQKASEAKADVEDADFEPGAIE